MAMSAILCCHVLAIGPQATSIRVIIIMTSHERHGVSNYQKLNCLFNSLFMVTSKKALSFALLILCEWNLPLTSGSSFFQLFQKISLAFSCRNYILFLCYLHSNWGIVHLLLYTHYLLLKNVLLFREIYELHSGEFPALDVFSDCLCPDTHPRAITNHTGLDLYCAQNIDQFDQYNIRRRDNPALSEFNFNDPATLAVAGLYIPEFLTDGMALPIKMYATVRIIFQFSPFL